MSFAQNRKTVHLIQSGTLSSQLTEDDKLTITRLTITGVIDLRDLDTLNEEAPNLSYLDMQKANIIQYSFGSMIYAENELPSETFMYNKSLKKVILPESLKIIRLNSFMESYIEEVVLGENVAIIDDGCFSNCEQLKKINIPSSVKHIGKDAFTQTAILTDNIAIED